MVKVEAIAVDIDGTITDEKRRLCHSSLDALRKAEDAGIPVIIVTGNISHFTYAVATMIGTSGGMVCENGGAIYKEGYNDNRMVVLGDINKGRAAYDFLVQEFGDEIPLRITEDDDARLSEITVYKLFDADPIKESLKDMDVEVYDSGFAIHLTDPEVDKGSSLRKLCELSGFNIENVMGVGDGENDIDFLKEVGIKIAVANAEDELKEFADYVCEKPYGDGVQEAVEKFVFNNE